VNKDRKLNSKNDKDALIRRLKRIEGQVKGIQSMVDDERYCIDILTQVTAVKSAINAVGVMILENHIKGCLIDAIENQEEDRDALIEELISLIGRYSK
jgi:DNA-binding FrmR family transcriptional regulator